MIFENTYNISDVLTAVSVFVVSASTLISFITSSSSSNDAFLTSNDGTPSVHDGSIKITSESKSILFKNFFIKLHRPFPNILSNKIPRVNNKPFYRVKCCLILPIRKPSPDRFRDLPVTSRVFFCISVYFHRLSQYRLLYISFILIKTLQKTSFIIQFFCS